MKAINFVNGYNRASDKDRYIFDAITTKYVNFEMKIALMKRIAENTTHIEAKGIKLFQVDSISRYMLLNLTLIDLYTSIDIDFKNVVTEYNLLDRDNLINKLISSIPEHEKALCSSVLDMAISDIKENERNILSFAENKMEAVKRVVFEMYNLFNKDQGIKDIFEKLANAVSKLQN